LQSAACGVVLACLSKAFQQAIVITLEGDTVHVGTGDNKPPIVVMKLKPSMLFAEPRCKSCVSIFEKQCVHQIACKDYVGRPSTVAEIPSTNPMLTESL